MHKELKLQLHGTNREVVSRIMRMVRARDDETKKRLREIERERYLSRLDPGTRDAIVAAEDAAIELRAGCMDTGHLLAGLLHLDDGPVADILRDVGLALAAVQPRLARGFSEEDASALATLGISLDDVIERVESSLGPDAMRAAKNTTFYRIAPSFEFMTTFSAAVLEADVRLATNVFPIHVLAAIVDTPALIQPTRAMAILHAAGCDIAEMRSAVAAQIGGRPPSRMAERNVLEGRGILAPLFRLARKQAERSGTSERPASR